MYADRDHRRDEARDRRDRSTSHVQVEYNIKHNITPETIKRAILDINPASGTTDYYAVPRGTSSGGRAPSKAPARSPELDVIDRIEALRLEMFAAAENLQFESAARLRDEIRKLQTGAGLEPGNGAPPESTRGSLRSRSQPPPSSRSRPPPSSRSRPPPASSRRRR